MNLHHANTPIGPVAMTDADDPWLYDAADIEPTEDNEDFPWFWWACLAAVLAGAFGPIFMDWIAL